MNYQKVQFPLASVPFVAGGNAAIDFATLQPQLAGRICHVTAIKFVVTATPVQSSLTVSPADMQKMVRSLQVKDGTGRQLFNGSFASNRLQDALENGGQKAPESDPAATTEAVNFVRVLPMDPGGFEDGTDFVQPAALFRGGSIVIAFGALSEITATTTGFTATVQAFVECELHDELILGSLVERYESVLSNGMPLGAEGLYTSVGLCKGGTFAPLVTGDLANVETIVNGFSRQAIHVADLERLYHTEKSQSAFVSIVHGEQRAATDDNPKAVNNTALASTAALVSPIIWTPDRAKISKLIFTASPNLVLKWSGSATSAYVLATRLIPRTAADVGKAEALVRQALGFGIRSMDARTASKAPYNGPRRAYMPLKCKVG